MKNSNTQLETEKKFFSILIYDYLIPKLIKIMQKVEEDIGEKTHWRVRMTEAAGTPLSIRVCQFFLNLEF